MTTGHRYNTTVKWGEVRKAEDTRWIVTGEVTSLVPEAL